MYRGEKKSIIYVLGLYLSSTLLLITTLFISYYYYEQEQFAHSEKDLLKKYTLLLTQQLSELNEKSSERYRYPRFNEFESAIYDIDKNLIFSTSKDIDITKFKDDFFTKESNSYFISSLTPYYFGAAYIIIEKKSKHLDILDNLIFIAIVTIIITLVTSVFLVNLVLRPMRENIKLLDSFIKDTTHELNTPITAILTNIETIDSSNCDEKTLRKLKRIKIASQSISNIYEDLVYILLNHRTSTQNIDLNLKEMLHQRVEYFTEMAHTKKIDFTLDIEKDVYFKADKKKIQRLIDNLISNAIKYSYKATTIKIILKYSSLIIEDEGKGMSKQEVKNIFTRYLRFDKSQGGFGIGYSIIKSIADEYKIKIDIVSKQNQGTKVALSW
ncbi:hypothetical protein M947_01365 [Sulfurimonas hongkongensis]|uniref:histidine kinase n=1 Tax=Sulfurimonas hongkongensis TaxID=1172190 RepID=T0KTZ1_9BACT|nr:HAMP domain-containing sensor histidine kinase [Sulfurimonas hongkongensis]EQB40474.1 hypothetical protein M947_01365 [Sulfurimonas hongkongensis]